MKPTTHQGLSIPQQIKYRPVVRNAWLRHCLTWDLDHKDKAAERAWYEQELFKAAGVRSTKDLRVNADEFGRLLLHFASLAQDRALVGQLATEDERRVQWLIRRCLDELTFLECRAVEWSYAVATFRHMKLPLTIEETPLPYLHKVFNALDTQVRRLLQARNKRLGTHMSRQELRTVVADQKKLEAAYA